jgi:hypothetical protein
MKESKEFYWAGAASGSTDYVSYYYDFVDTKVFNLQLRYWVEALSKYQQIYEGNFKVEELILILNLLCQSLETLAGVNIKPRERTPSLLTMYKKSLKVEKGWDIHGERRDLFNCLEEMVRYHNNLCKHINKSNSRKDLLSQISYEKIRKYLKTTKDIWLWILGKIFSGNIPDNQLILFKYDF